MWSHAQDLGFGHTYWKTLNGKLHFFVMFFIMWLIAYFIFSLFSWEKQPPEVFCVKKLACSFIKKETLAQVFSCEFGEISKNTFLQSTSGRLLLNWKVWNYDNRNNRNVFYQQCLEIVILIFEIVILIILGREKIILIHGGAKK